MTPFAYLFRLCHRARWNRYTLFIAIVWRPVTSDPGDTYWQAWKKYRLDAATAWSVAKIVY